MTLFKQHIRNEAISTIIWAAVFGLVGFLTTALWETMITSGSITEMQKTFENAQGVLKGIIGSAGMGLFTLDGWIQGYTLGTWITLPYGVFTALFAAGMVTREMDRRTMEFILALPVSRAQLIISRWLVLASSLAAIHLVHMGGILAGLAFVGQEGNPGRYALAVVNMFLLFLFLGSLLLLISLFIDDYGPGTGALLGVGLGLNFLHMALADATGALKTLRGMLPFALYDPPAIITRGEIPWGDMTLLAGGAFLFLALSVWVFQRKQIAV